MNALPQFSSQASGPRLDNRRIAAGVVDLAVVGLVAAVLRAAAGGEFTAGLAVVTIAWALFYYFVSESTWSQTLGKRLLGLRLLMIPEEHAAPRVLRNAAMFMRRAAPAPAWEDVVTDPWLFDVVRAAMGPRNTTWGSRGRARRLLLRGLVEQDHERLAPADRMRLLSEPQSIVFLRDQLAANTGLGPHAVQRLRA